MQFDNAVLDYELKAIIAVLGFASIVSVPTAYFDSILTSAQSILLEFFFISGLMVAIFILIRSWRIEELAGNNLYRFAGFVLLFIVIPIAAVFDVLMAVDAISFFLNHNSSEIIAKNREIISMIMNIFIIAGLFIAIITCSGILISKKKVEK